MDNSKKPVGKTNLVVVIPAYKVSDHILPLLELIGPEVSRIIVVDDACPENSGSIVQQYCSDPRVEVLRHEVNLGVGGATKTGIVAAIVSGATIII